MRRQYKKYAIWGAAFATLITLGAATAAFTAGAAPFRADATTTIVTTITTGSTTVVTTISPSPPDRRNHRGALPRATCQRAPSARPRRSGRTVV